MERGGILLKRGTLKTQVYGKSLGKLTLVFSYALDLPSAIALET